PSTPALCTLSLHDALPISARGYHPYGASDPEGFAAMCVVELLVHGADIAAGLSLAFETPGDVCRRAVDRLFPDVDDHDDQWELLDRKSTRLNSSHLVISYA